MSVADPAATDHTNPLIAAGGALSRRAPFSENPDVGPRGQRTQQRIIRATLHVLQRDGYHRCSVERITAAANCSRASFYQYFSSKEDIVYYLANVVASEVGDAIKSVEHITPDEPGWNATRRLVARYGDIYDRYGAMYLAYETAAGAEPEIAAIRGREGLRNLQRLRSRVAGAASIAESNAVISLLLECIFRTFAIADVLHADHPSDVRRDRLVDALADAVHRSLFGPVRGVNLRPAAKRRPRNSSPRSLAVLTTTMPPAATGPTLERLQVAGRDAFVRRGYNGTRIDDIVAAAGVSRGAFYRYFDNKAHLAQVLVAQSLRPVSAVMQGIPAAAEVRKDADALRDWLKGYNVTEANEAGVLHAWIDATLQNADLEATAGPALEWARQQLAEFLAPRRFGDVDLEAIVAVALLDIFGSRLRSRATLEAATQIMRRGMMGTPT